MWKLTKRNLIIFLPCRDLRNNPVWKRVLAQVPVALLLQSIGWLNVCAYETLWVYLSTQVWVRAALKSVVEEVGPAAQPLFCPRNFIPVRAELSFWVFWHPCAPLCRLEERCLWWLNEETSSRISRFKGQDNTSWRDSGGKLGRWCGGEWSLNSKRIWECCQGMKKLLFSSMYWICDMKQIRYLQSDAKGEPTRIWNMQVCEKKKKTFDPNTFLLSPLRHNLSKLQHHANINPDRFVTVLQMY